MPTDSKLYPNPTMTLDASELAKIEKNFHRLQKLPDLSGNLLADWETEQHSARLAAYEAERARIHAEEASRDRGEDLPLFS